MATQASQFYNTADSLLQLDPTLTTLALNIIIYDSAPIIVQLDNPNQNYRVPASPLIYQKNASCRPFRLITVVSRAKHDVTVQIQVLQPSPNTPTTLEGLVNPVTLVNLNRQSLFPIFSTITYVDYMAAAAAVMEECIGKHIGIVRTYGQKVLSNPRFWGTYTPFLYNITNTFPQITNYTVYPHGFDYAAATTTGDSPLQISPFICRPVNENEDTIMSFRNMVHAISSTLGIVIPNVTLSSETQTPVEMYKNVQPNI
jgi:hypothetical protein